MNGVFHEGELLVQSRAELTEEATRLARMLESRELSSAMVDFVATSHLAFITSHDSTGTLWTSPVYGAPGFCQAAGTSLRITVPPPAGDPLHELVPGAHIGLLFIDFRRRRRLRVNGVLTATDHGAEVTVDQAYGNCPQYIRQVETVVSDTLPVPKSTSLRPRGVGANTAEFVSHVDTLLVGTDHPAGGADTSHRGGPPGFVRVEGDELWWPDYPGNNVFNSMGNIAVSPSTALLFLDFRLGASMQMSGTARLDWNCPPLQDEERPTGRRVWFSPERCIRTEGLPLTAT